MAEGKNKQKEQKLEERIIVRAALEQGVTLAKSLGAKVTLLYMTGTVPSMYNAQTGVEEEMSE